MIRCLLTIFATEFPWSWEANSELGQSFTLTKAIRLITFSISERYLEFLSEKGSNYSLAVLIAASNSLFLIWLMTFKHLSIKYSWLVSLFSQKPGSIVFISSNAWSISPLFIKFFISHRCLTSFSLVHSATNYYFIFTSNISLFAKSLSYIKVPFI